MATIKIQRIKAEANIGITGSEKNQLQPIIVNVELEYDDRAAMASDSISDVVDYNSLTQDIVKTVQNFQGNLLESLAKKIKDKIHTNEKIKRSTVEVIKPNAMENGVPSVIITTKKE